MKVNHFSPTFLANTPDLAVHSRKIEEMHNIAKGELVKLAQPTVFYSRINEIEIPEISNAKTDPTENHQDNGSMPTFNSYPSPSHSSPEDTLVAYATPTQRPSIEVGNAALQAQEGDLLDVRLLGANYMIYVIYQDWVHQNPRDHLD